MYPTIAGVLLVLLSGCTVRDMHNHVQNNRQLECRSEPTPDLRASCQAEADQSYESWQQALKELNDKPEVANPGSE